MVESRTTPAILHSSLIVYLWEATLFAEILWDDIEMHVRSTLLVMLRLAVERMFFAGESLWARAT